MSQKYLSQLLPKNDQTIQKQYTPLKVRLQWDKKVDLEQESDMRKLVRKLTSEYSSRLTDNNSTLSKKTSTYEYPFQQKQQQQEPGFQYGRPKTFLMHPRNKPSKSQIGRGYYNIHNPLVVQDQAIDYDVDEIIRNKILNETIPIPIQRVADNTTPSHQLNGVSSDLNYMAEIDTSMRYLNKLKKDSSQKFIKILGKLSESSRKLITPKKMNFQSKTPDMISGKKDHLMNTDSATIRNILNREKSVNNLVKKLSSSRLHNQKIKTMLKAAELARINNSRNNKDLNTQNNDEQHYYTQVLNKKASVKNFGTPTRRATNKQLIPFDTPYVVPQKKVLKKNHSKIQLKKAIEQLEQYDLIDQVQRDLVENHLLKSPQHLQSLSINDSFVVLPDQVSDDERIQRGELKRFTANTHSGQSLLIGLEDSRKLRNSKNHSHSNLEDLKSARMHRSSETIQQIKDNILKIETPNFSNDNSQKATPTRINVSPEQQIKLALQTLQLYDISQRQNYINDTIQAQNAMLGIDLTTSPAVFDTGKLTTFQLPLSKIHRFHPIFNKMSKEGAKMIIRECCQILFLKKNQVLYSEGDIQTNIYIPLYGQIRMWSKKRGMINKSAGLGKTLGEEALCDCYYINRTESAYVLEDAAVLCIERDEWIAARDRLLEKSLIGRQILISPVLIGCTQGLNKFDKVIRDINLLDEVFRFNFYQKRKAKVSGYRGAILLPSIKYGNNYSYLLNGQYRVKNLNDADQQMKQVKFLKDSGVRNFFGDINRTLE